MLKILQHDKIWGDSPPAPNYGAPPVSMPLVTVASAHICKLNKFLQQWLE